MVKAVRWISFNPRSYKRSDLSSKCLSYFFFSFNPRSYKRSDTFVKGLKDAIKLSIHAPTRGATNASSTASADSIFQSTFLQEERQFLSFASGSYFYFQSTLLQEERRPTQRGKMRYLYLSIHAPTRGATTKTGHIPVLGNFQSTLLQEERLQQLQSCSLRSLFQSTLLQEERQSHSSIPIPFILLSIHAPTRGATTPSITYCTPSSLSIHAPTRGATCRGNPPPRPHCPFNPRSYKRSDFFINEL